MEPVGDVPARQGATSGSPPEPETAQALVSLGREECFRLLAGARMGRVVFVADDTPIALPVNFALDGDGVVFAVARGTVLDAVGGGAIASFQVDGFDRIYHLGWSVLVSGPALELAEPADLRRVGALPLQPWAPGARDRFIRLAVVTVSGRRIVDAPPAEPPGPAPPAGSEATPTAVDRSGGRVPRHGDR